MDGSVRVFESGAIMLYLAQKHPDAGLYSEVGLYTRAPVLFHCQRATVCCKSVFTRPHWMPSCPVQVHAAIQSVRSMLLCDDVVAGRSA